MIFEKLDKKSSTFSSVKLWFTILFVLLWCQHTIFNFIIAVINKIYFQEEISNLIFPVCVFLSVIFALPYIKNTLSNPYHNGFVEGNNNFIKVLKRIAFGFRSFRRFKARIMICKNLLHVKKASAF